jgi:hypothetical protein
MDAVKFEHGVAAGNAFAPKAQPFHWRFCTLGSPFLSKSFAFMFDCKRYLFSFHAVMHSACQKQNMGTKRDVVNRKSFMGGTSRVSANLKLER